MYLKPKKFCGLRLVFLWASLNPLLFSPSRYYFKIVYLRELELLFNVEGGSALSPPTVSSIGRGRGQSQLCLGQPGLALGGGERPEN